MKPVVLTFVRHYLPGYLSGGPTRTIANLVERLGDEFEFRIVTSDRDFGAEQPYTGIQLNKWTPRAKALVRYVRPSEFGLRKCADLARSTQHDVIYLNSFFDPRFTQKAVINHRLGRLPRQPIVIAPRGEFSERALELKAHKKRTFIAVAKALSLYDGLIWQASSAHELADIERVMAVGSKMAGRIAIAPNLTLSGQTGSENGMPLTRRPSTGALRVCFLSRISPMKNLDFALRVLQGVRAPIHFAVYGPIEDQAYWQRCQQLIAKTPSNIGVSHEGIVEPTEVVATLSKHDLFFLPSRGENFGHVIHEALSAGLPVLISDRTPWRDLSAAGIGWDLPLDDERAFITRIEDIAAWSDEARQTWSSRARAHAATVAQDTESIEANRRLFLDAIRAQTA